MTRLLPALWMKLPPMVRPVKLPFLCDSFVEVAACEQLHHDVDQVIVFVDFVNGNEVFVVAARLDGREGGDVP